jgi:hypothetical protein
MKVKRRQAGVAVLIAASALMATAQAGEKLAAVSPKSKAEEGQKLSADEIAALFPGRYEAIWKDKHQVSVVAGPDGEISGSYGIFSGSGRWSIVGDELCVASRWLSSNRPRCSEVVLHRGWYLGMQNSKGKPRVRFRPL